MYGNINTVLSKLTSKGGDILYIDDGFSLNLMAARVNRNLSREEVANKVGVTSRTIQSWENGKTVPDARKVVALSKLYDTPATLFRFDP